MRSVEIASVAYVCISAGKRSFRVAGCIIASAYRASYVFAPVVASVVRRIIISVISVDMTSYVRVIQIDFQWSAITVVTWVIAIGIRRIPATIVV